MFENVTPVNIRLTVVYWHFWMFECTFLAVFESGWLIHRIHQILCRGRMFCLSKCCSKWISFFFPCDNRTQAIRQCNPLLMISVQVNITFKIFYCTSWYEVWRRLKMIWEYKQRADADHIYLFIIIMISWYLVLTSYGRAAINHQQ